MHGLAGPMPCTSTGHTASIVALAACPAPREACLVCSGWCDQFRIGRCTLYSFLHKAQDVTTTPSREGQTSQPHQGERQSAWLGHTSRRRRSQIGADGRLLQPFGRDQPDVLRVDDPILVGIAGNVRPSLKPMRGNRANVLCIDNVVMGDVAFQVLLPIHVVLNREVRTENAADPIGTVQRRQGDFQDRARFSFQIRHRW